MEARLQFEEVDHTADRAFRVRGRNLAELFERAARGLFALEQQCAGGPANVQREVKLFASDPETLLVNWLNELLYLQEIHRECYPEIEVARVTDSELTAMVRGRLADVPRRVVKAVTFHNLHVQRRQRGWEATIVVDV